MSKLQGMVFGLARACKWRVIYVDDRVPESQQKEMVMIFFRNQTLWDFMNNHTHFTIKRMTIMYEYPTLDHNDGYK